jgi:K+-transporting ATPase KdpF subunit
VRIVSVANIVGLALSVLIALLLVAALIYPERF